MIKIWVAIDDTRVRSGWERYPEIFSRHVSRKLARGAHEVAADEKRVLAENRSMARSTLANSIRVEQIAALHYQVVAGTNYARWVEEGTRPGYFPNPTHLRDYVKQRAGIRLTGRPGGPTRRRQMDEIRDRAGALARHIQAHGTRAHPFARVAAKRKRGRVFELVREGERAAAAEAFGSAAT